MPPRNWLLRVTDILDAIAAIQAYTVGMEFTNLSMIAKPLML